MELPKAHDGLIGRITILVSELEGELFQLTIAAVRHAGLITYLADQTRDMDRAFDLAFGALLQEGTLEHAARRDAARPRFDSLRECRDRFAHGLWRNDDDRCEVTVSLPNSRILRGSTKKRYGAASRGVEQQADIRTVSEAELGALLHETISVLIEVVEIKESLNDVAGP